jgi:hypothetical protein
MNQTEFTFEDFLDSIGDVKIIDLIYLVVLPFIGLLGFFLNLTSMLIFFKNEFSHPMFVYYRVLTIFYASHLFFLFPYGICFSPRYLYLPLPKKINTHFTAWFVMSFTHFECYILYVTGCLECVIVLERMKDFSQFLKNKFTISPLKMSLIISLFCLLVEAFLATEYVICAYPFKLYESIGNGSYNEINGEVYSVIISSITSSKVGFIIDILIFTVKDVVTLLISVMLNAISFFQIIKFLHKKEVKFNSPNLKITLSSNTRDTSNTSSSTSKSTSSISQKSLISSFTFNKSKSKSHKSQKNLSLMITSLITLNIFVRLSDMVCLVYCLISLDLIASILGCINDLAIALNSSLPFFIFYKFNSKFRKEFHKISGFH